MPSDDLCLSTHRMSESRGGQLFMAREPHCKQNGLWEQVKYHMGLSDLSFERNGLLVV